MNWFRLFECQAMPTAFKNTSEVRTRIASRCTDKIQRPHFAGELKLGIKGEWNMRVISRTPKLQLFILSQRDRVSSVLYRSDQSDLFMPCYQSNMSRKGIGPLRVLFYQVLPEALPAISEAPVSKKLRLTFSWKALELLIRQFDEGNALYTILSEV